MQDLVVEYKGGHIATTEDIKEKTAIGELWQAKSKAYQQLEAITA